MIFNSDDKQIPPHKQLIVFVAYEVGHSELASFINSMKCCALMDHIFVIFPPDSYALFHSHVKHCIEDGFKSVPDLIAKIELWKSDHDAKFEGIMGVDEEEQFSLSFRIAQHFGLPFHSKRTCSIASNKFLLKTFFKKHRVPTGRFTLISTVDDPNIAYVKFPNILKVLSGNGSAYLCRNDNPEQLKLNFKRMKNAVLQIEEDSRFRKQSFEMNGKTVNLDPKQQFLLEEFIPGQEFSCDFIKLGTDGAVKLIRVVKKINGSFLGLFNGYLLLKEEDLETNHIDLSYLTGVCRRIANTFNIDSGVCMVDFKIHHGKIKIIESSIRPGLSAFNHLMYEIYGYTSLVLMAKQKIGIDNLADEIRFPKENGGVVYLYGPEKPGLYRVDTSELEKLKSSYSISYIHIYDDSRGSDTSNSSEQESDSLRDPSHRLKGYVILKRVDPGKLSEIADLFNRTVKFIPIKDFPQGEISGLYNQYTESYN